MLNWKGNIRDWFGTARTMFSISHVHLIRMKLKGNKAFYRYARPLFHGYIQSLNPCVEVMPYIEVMRKLGIENEDLALTIPHLDGYVGLSDWERVTLGTIARQYADWPMFEIGTAAGSTAILLGRNTTQQVFTLDLPEEMQNHDFALTRMKTDDEVVAYRERGSLLRQFPQENVVELTGDSATFDFRPYEGRIGLFFIDGAHSFEYVRSDTINACRCCMQHGIIVWHDFGSSRDVSRFLNSLAHKGAAICSVELTSLAFSTDLNCIQSLL